MIGSIKKLFQSEIFTSKISDSGRRQLSQTELRLACAALLVEVAVIDNQFDDAELTLIKKLLKEEFNIADDDISDMVETAHNESKDSTSMYQFTRLVNDHCDFEDKFKLITSMWRIAYADGNLDKYEEYIIRKVADLIHVSHGDFIRAKINARNPI